MSALFATLFIVLTQTGGTSLEKQLAREIPDHEVFDAMSELWTLGRSEDVNRTALSKTFDRVIELEGRLDALPSRIVLPWNHKKPRRWNLQNREKRITKWNDVATLAVRTDVQVVRIRITVSHSVLMHRRDRVYLYVEQTNGPSVVIRLPLRMGMPKGKFSGLNMLAEVRSLDKTLELGVNTDIELVPLRLELDGTRYIPGRSRPGMGFVRGGHSVSRNESLNLEDFLPPNSKSPTRGTATP